MIQGRLPKLAAAAILVVAFLVGFQPPVSADIIPSDFNLQVTPSPLVATVKPGIKTQIELKIRNGGSGSEQLKIEPRSFSLSNDSSKVTLLDTTPPEIASWISFSQPKFTIAPGEWENEAVTLNVPKDAGFSYSFALVVSRQNPPKASSGRVINGSLAVFTLINVDRPGASTNLQIASFTASKHVYEYLPATLSVRFHNAGNTIAQPYGNIFIGRGSASQNPMASLTVNKTHGYILPNTERTIAASWSDGFPAYQIIQNPDGTTKQKLAWNWGDLSKLRIGRYTAHLVAVYSQNGRDVPIEGSVSFWVIPWKILIGVLLVALLLLFALFMLLRTIARPIWRRLRKKNTVPEAPEKAEND
ncbi:MAG TPA: hypothetical protein VLG92_00500 [Candidatus Saccharimonadia bacterium]|nr:hypothetical protein [Candidatus Saccharimonadia bacterium]